MSQSNPDKAEAADQSARPRDEGLLSGHRSLHADGTLWQADQPRWSAPSVSQFMLN